MNNNAMQTQGLTRAKKKVHRHNTLEAVRLFNWIEGHKEEARTVKSKALAARLTVELGFPISHSQVAEARRQLGLELAIIMGPRTGTVKRGEAIQMLTRHLIALRKELGLPEAADLASIITPASE
jgi:transposase